MILFLDFISLQSNKIFEFYAKTYVSILRYKAILNLKSYKELLDMNNYEIIGYEVFINSEKMWGDEKDGGYVFGSDISAKNHIKKTGVKTYFLRKARYKKLKEAMKRGCLFSFEPSAFDRMKKIIKEEGKDLSFLNEVETKRIEKGDHLFITLGWT
jgi:hypothetical protein